MYLKNTWYVAGFAAEIDDDRPLTRTLLDQPIVLPHAAVERHGLLWWWGGDAALADPALIPDYSLFQHAHPHGSFRGYLPTQCHYELLVDNILDLTHADYLHAGSLGNGSLTRAKARVTECADPGVRHLRICTAG